MDCFLNRDVPHDWRRIPFWHPDSWADHYTHRCAKCHVVRTASPTVASARAWLAWFIALRLFAAFGLFEVLRLAWGALH